MDSLMRLVEVAPLTRMTIKSAQHKLKRGTFPIRHVQGVVPYVFTRSDVAAYVERGEVTNPNLLQPRSRFFQSARRRSA
jgi:predicted DNA-binding transcriptional regulator AlpA